ncbi:biotin--protein ligase [Proteus mirabilis]|uniref:Biotin--protein ligase n=1 Tax=Proteus mirabilis TaxID=584 RepID=A0A2X2CCJ5_PROMI|nr:biotin--protein ligase [Proteus mirabilis]
MKETSTPLLLINILADGELHSGEQLGESLGMTRAGINKHIKTLRSWGYRHSYSGRSGLSARCTDEPVKQ